MYPAYGQQARSSKEEELQCNCWLLAVLLCQTPGTVWSTEWPGVKYSDAIVLSACWSENKEKQECPRQGNDTVHTTCSNPGLLSLPATTGIQQATDHLGSSVIKSSLLCRLSKHKTTIFHLVLLRSKCPFPWHSSSTSHGTNSLWNKLGYAA